MDIKDFLLARIEEDEAVARGAVDEGKPGFVWRWETTETDTPVPSRDLAEAQQHQRVSLRSTEEFPSSAGPLPFFAIGYAEDVHSGAGAHITRHDPARILRECATKRAVIASHASCTAMTAKEQEPGVKLVGAGMVQGLDLALKSLAAAYVDHRDYQKEWAA